MVELSLSEVINLIRVSLPDRLSSYLLHVGIGGKFEKEEQRRRRRGKIERKYFCQNEAI